MTICRLHCTDSDTYLGTTDTPEAPMYGDRIRIENHVFVVNKREWQMDESVNHDVLIYVQQV